MIEVAQSHALYVLDREGRVTSWNPGAEKLLGYRKEEILGEHFSRFHPPEAVALGKPQRELETAQAEGWYEEEGWRVAHDGSRFWARSVLVPIYEESGRLSGFAKAVRDETDRKRAEQELRSAEERFRRLVEGLENHAVVMLDARGRVTSWNPGAVRIFGYTGDEIIGAAFSRLFTDEDVADGQPARLLQRAHREGRYCEEGWLVRKDGSRFWARVEGIRLSGDESGPHAVYAVVVQDDTERLQHVQELKAGREELARSLEHERAVVLRLAEAFLGRIPRDLPGFRVGALYKPAVEAERVGGDYYDFTRLGPGRLGIVIGDVCGKGLSAAVYTSITICMLRYYAHEENRPKVTIAKLNRAMCQEMREEGLFVTLFFGILDIERGLLTYVNAGHPAPVLRRKRNGSCERLENTGGIVGVLPAMTFAEAQVTLDPGDVLAMFTDGVTEAGGTLETDTDQTVSQVLCQQSDGHSPREVARAIFKQTEELAAGRLLDDVAIVVIERQETS